MSRSNNSFCADGINRVRETSGNREKKVQDVQWKVRPILKRFFEAEALFVLLELLLQDERHHIQMVLPRLQLWVEWICRPAWRNLWLQQHRLRRHACPTGVRAFEAARFLRGRQSEASCWGLDSHDLVYLCQSGHSGTFLNVSVSRLAIWRHYRTVTGHLDEYLHPCERTRFVHGSGLWRRRLRGTNSRGQLAKTECVLEWLSAWQWPNDRYRSGARSNRYR